MYVGMRNRQFASWARKRGEDAAFLGWLAPLAMSPDSVELGLELSQLGNSGSDVPDMLVKKRIDRPAIGVGRGNRRKQGPDFG